jgi:hypothetical protein
MSTPVQRLVEDALVQRERSVLLGAFVAAARLGAAEEDYRDGLLDMPLPFYAAATLGFDADELVEESAGHLSEGEEAFLRTFAARDDRNDIAVMGWSAVEGGQFHYKYPV